MVTRRSFLITGLLVTLLASAVGCRKESNNTSIPLSRVDISINLNNPSYIDLAVPGGWLYLTGGTSGIIVYRRTVDDFVALDRTCTYQPQNLCQVRVDSTEILAVDMDCCQSTFLIVDGSVTQGPSVMGLQQYNTSFNGSILRIFN
jgi:nitrite reductase/ring-hydroxylating ferredoxin subunit